MALVNGTNYDHIDLQAAAGGDVTRHKLQDTDGRALVAPTEASSTASAAHAAGTYFILGGVLYRATANISQGGSIVTSGTGQNCEAVTVAGEVSKTNGAVSDLKSAMTDYEINFSTAQQIPGLINSFGKYTSGALRTTKQISAQGIAYLSIKANAYYRCEYAFLASTMIGLSDNDNITFAEGETGKRILQSGEEIMIQVPAGCNYITFLNTAANGDIYLPAYAVALKASSPAINKGLEFKKCGVIGHSGPYGTQLSNRSDAWPYIAAGILEIPNVNNIAVGGSTIAKQEDSYEEIYFSLADFEAADKDTTKKYLVKDDPTDAHPFMIYQYSNDAWAAEYSSHNAVNGARAPVVDVVHSLDADVDIIIIGAGANDYQYGWTPFGAVNDTPTKYTFCGAVHLLLQYIMATYPGVPVSFSDAIIWNRSLYTTANSIGKTYLDYLNAMKEIARMYKIPYVDFDAISSFPYPSDDATWYAGDQKHMSKKGHERVGQVVAAQIKSILG